MSRVGMAPLSSMGMSTMVMKSVPSPGSPVQTPFSSTPSVSTSSWRLAIFSRSFCTASAVSTSPSGMKSAASGTISSIAAASGTSTTSALLASSAILAASAALAASSAAFSAFVLRPRRLGASSTTGASFASASAGSSACGSGRSLNSDGVSRTFLRLVFVSRFSPSEPLTVYTLFVSFLVMRVRFLFVVSPPSEAALSAALSIMA